MDLIGTILVGPKEQGVERAIKSLKECGCGAIHALIDTVDRKSLGILKDYDCQVFDRDWNWEFGPARDFLQSTIPPGVKWQIWLDSDDEIPHSSIRAIRQLVQSPPAVISMPYVYVTDGKSYRSLYRIRMFPPRGVHWHMRAHEHATFPSGLRSLPMNIPILHHWASHGIDRSLRYVGGLQKDLAEWPNDPRVKFYLAQSLKEVGRIDDSIRMYQGYLESGGWSEERMKAYIMLSYMFQQKDMLDKALEMSMMAGRELDEPRREVFQRVGEVYFAKEDWDNAYIWFEKELSIGRPKIGLLYVCEDHYGRRPLDWLVFVCEKLGRNEDGAKYCEQILQLDSTDSDTEISMKYFRIQHNQALKIGAMPVPDTAKPLICLFGGPAFEVWNAESLEKGGIGGLETANVYMAKAFQKLGWEVVLFTSSPGGEYVGIKHVHCEKFHEYCRQYNPDVVLISRHSNLVDNEFSARVKVLWTHDLHFGEDPTNSRYYLTDERMGKFDLILFQSPYHEYLNRNKYVIPEEKSHLIRLGIDTQVFENSDIKRIPTRCIYASSADRGLPRLLDLWSLIRQAVPDAELHVFYGFDNFLNQAKRSDEQTAKKIEDWVEHLMTRMKDLSGVEYHGRVGQDELAKEFLLSAVWAHPTKFHETLCITALTACAAGCVPLTSNLAALETTVGKHGILLEGDADSPEYKKEFVNELIRLLTDAQYWAKWSEEARHNIYDRYNKSGLQYWSWDTVATELDEVFKSRLEVSDPLEKDIPDGIFVEVGAGIRPMIAPGQNIIHTDLAVGMEHQECVCDGRALPFKNDSLGGVIMRQILEHLGWRETQPALERAWDVIQPGGSISVSVPDFYAQVSEFMEGRKNIYRISDMVFCFQDRPENIHKAVFTLASLRSCLARAGFSLTKVIREDSRLSVEALKPIQYNKIQICDIVKAKIGEYDVVYPQSLYADSQSWWWNSYPMESDLSYTVHRSNEVSDPLLSIVLIAHKQLDERTVYCVNKLRQVLQGVSYELIGVDDGSCDGTDTFFKGNVDTTVTFPVRRGISEAYNAGVSVSNASTICMIQNDVNMEPGVIDHMFEYLQRKKNIGLVCPLFVEKSYRGEKDEDFLILPTYPEFGGSAWAVAFPAGPCMMMRRKDFVRAGRFDPYMFNKWVEHDFGRSVNDLGLSIAISSGPTCGYFAGDASILHTQDYTIQEHIRRFMSVYYFHLKWGYELDSERMLSVEI